MKGQFLVISSIIIGVMIITTASAISQTRSMKYTNEPDSYFIHMVKGEAEKIDTSDNHERREFKEMTEMVQDYRAFTSYSRSADCFNITLVNPRTELNIIAPESSCPS